MPHPVLFLEVLEAVNVLDHPGDGEEGAHVGGVGGDGKEGVEPPHGAHPLPRARPGSEAAALGSEGQVGVEECFLHSELTSLVIILDKCDFIPENSFLFLDTLYFSGKL